MKGGGRREREREREGINLHPALSCCEVGDHLHDLNLSVVLISLDMAAIVNKKVKKLTRRSRSATNSISTMQSNLVLYPIRIKGLQTEDSVNPIMHQIPQILYMQVPMDTCLNVYVTCYLIQIAQKA